jgi:hypothetical protein
MVIRLRSGYELVEHFHFFTHNLANPKLGTKFMQFYLVIWLQKNRLQGYQVTGYQVT